MTTLVWFREDLRISDNPALTAATEHDESVVAVYVLEEESEYVRELGGAAKWWLHHSLASLSEALEGLGIQLVLRKGNPETIINQVAGETGAARVFWNRRYGEARNHDVVIKTELQTKGIEAKTFMGDLLFEPWTIKNQSGNPYRVYSAFWRACTAEIEPAKPTRIGNKFAKASARYHSEDLGSWNLTPTKPNWAEGIAARWKPGEKTAKQKLAHFLESRAQNYSKRDYPAIDAGSELSPHLRWGEISPRQLWHSATLAKGDIGLFLSEIGWREFAKHTAFHFGPLHKKGLNPTFDEFPWQTPTNEYLEKWQQGKTGFGIVDAGMQELWQTGFMHNRVRMIAASFFTKNMGVDWRTGEAWFWETLVDADEASNPFNWQWVAGCGADAAPYFRIFNPELQQKKFDPEGEYVAKWAPMSAALPKMLDLKTTRANALAAYHSLSR